MSIENEKGGILLELVITVYLLAFLLLGTLEMHQRLKVRFTRILQNRNSGITAARAAP